MAWLKPIAGKINDCRLKAPNRGFAAILDAAVHASRYDLTGDRKYHELVLRHLELAEKCGGNSEKKASRLLREIVASMDKE